MRTFLFFCPSYFRIQKFRFPFSKKNSVTWVVKYEKLQRLPLTRALERFFLSLSFRGHQSTVSMVFSRALTEKVSSPMNEGRRLTRISNVDGVFNYFIEMKDYIVKQRGLCELSEIAKTLSIVYVKVFRLFIYLIV